MNITKDIKKIKIDGKELSFFKVRISNWRDGVITGISVRTEEKIMKYYMNLWKQTVVDIEVFFEIGLFLKGFAHIISIKDSLEGQYEYHFYEKTGEGMRLKRSTQTKKFY
ncbi:hypothetical protein HFP66_00170 [Bacillus sp. A17A.1]